MEANSTKIYLIYTGNEECIRNYINEIDGIM